MQRILPKYEQSHNLNKILLEKNRKAIAFFIFQTQLLKFGSDQWKSHYSVSSDLQKLVENFKLSKYLKVSKKYLK